MEVNMLNLPKTREQARQEGSKAYFTGLFCKQGHIAKRWTATGNCSECQRKHTNAWVKANPEKVKAFHESNEQREKVREYGKKHYQKNKVYYLEKWHARRASKLQATTKWGQEGVRAFYLKAKELEAANPGVKYEVDHIVPLAGTNVCGLHNQFNLQVITRKENRTKARKWNLT